MKRADADAVTARACPTCGAERLVRCQTSGGDTLRYNVHAARRVAPAGPAPLEVRAVRVDPQTWGALERMAAAVDLPTSVIVRLALDDYLARNGAR